MASKPDVLDAEAYLDKVTGAVDYGHRTNWYDELINKNNFGHNHNISLSGGSETTIFRMSANFKGKEDWISLLIVKNTVYVETLSIRLWRGCWK